MQYRWAKAGLSLLGCFYDQSNAFNSMEWKYLERTFLPKFSPSDRRYLQLRNRRSLCILGDALGRAIIYIAGTGTRQGDTPAAQEFAIAFHKLVRAFDHSEYNALESAYFALTCPITKTHTFLGSTTWADDLLKWKILTSNLCVEHEATRVSDVFSRILEPAGMALNPKQLSSLCRFLGPDPEKRRKNSTLRLLVRLFQSK